MKIRSINLMLAVLISLVSCRVSPAPLQVEKIVTAEDYARAERFLAASTSKLVSNARVRPIWIGNDKLIYRKDNVEGYEFMLVNAVKGKQAPAFDHQKLAKALSDATDEKYEAFKLPFYQFKLTDNGKSIVFEIRSHEYKWDIKKNLLTKGKSKKMIRNSI